MNNIEKSIEEIVKTLRANKSVVTHKNFMTIPYANFRLSDAQKFAFETVEEIRKLVQFGVSHGFTNDNLYVISKLSILAVKAIDVKDTKGLNKIIEQKNTDLIRLHSRQEAGVDVKQPVIDLIDDTIDGLNSLIKENGTKQSKIDRFNLTISQLEAVKESISSVWDESSILAKECARSVFNSIRKMRLQVVSGMTEYEVKQAFANINKTLTQWAELRSAKVKKTSEKEFNDIFVFPENYVDSFILASQSNIFIQKFDVVRENIEDYKERNLSDKTSVLQERLNTLKEQKVAQIKHIQELSAKLQKKQIGDKEFNIQASAADKLITRLDVEIERSQKEVARVLNQNLSFQTIVDVFDDLIRSVDSAKTNPALLYSYYKTVDFDNINLLLSGIASQEQSKQAIDSVVKQIQLAGINEAHIVEMAKQADQMINDAKEQIDIEKDAIEAKYEEEVEELSEEDLENANSSLANKYASFNFEEEAPAAEEEAKEEKEEDIVNSVDDII